MQVPFVMTVIGKDRPGLVESVASLVAQQGGNWLESRMCRLGGEFAGLLRVHVPADKEQALLQSLKTLQDQGLTVVIHPDQPAQELAPPRALALALLGFRGDADGREFVAVAIEPAGEP